MIEGLKLGARACLGLFLLADFCPHWFNVCKPRPFPFLNLLRSHGCLYTIFLEPLYDLALLGLRIANSDLDFTSPRAQPSDIIFVSVKPYHVMLSEEIFFEIHIIKIFWKGVKV